MLKQVDQLLVVHGVTAYKCHAGIPEPFPIMVDTGSITLPQITFPSFSSQMMGDCDCVDQCRINPMTTTVEAELSVLQSHFHGYGVQEYLFKWAQQMKNEAGLFNMVGFSAYIAGIPSEDVQSTVRVGEGTMGSLNISTLKYRLVAGTQELRHVDKRLGILQINGVDYRAQLRTLL